jgi:hypothetical protein
MYGANGNKVITVTWTDGRTETYQDVVWYEAKDGVLTIVLGRMFVRPGEARNEHHFPLINIREWRVR